MAQSQIIAKVSELSGQAFARDSAGNMRRLKLGDVIREGESVVAADGAKLVLALADGREMSVRPGETVRLDAEVAAAVKPDAADSAVVNNQAGFQKIAKALQSGGDLDALLEEEAPAAGLVGQGGNEGHTFVELLRIVETVDPLAYQFGTNRGRPIETIEGAPVTVAAAGEPEQVLFARNDANAVSELVDSAAASKVSGNVLAAGAVSDVADSGLPGAVLAVTQIRFGATVAAPGSVIALAHGTLVVAADGSYTYTLSNTDPAVNALNVGDQLSEQVTYTITDGLGHTAQANLTLTINGANDSPTATPSVTPIVAVEDSSVAVPVGGSDPDSPIAFVTVTTLPTDGVLLKPDGTPVVAGEAIPVDPVTHQALLTFVPSANFSGPVSFPFTVTDTGGLTSAQATQQIDVNPVNDPPVAVVIPASGDEDTAITINLSGTDIDGSIKSVTVTTLPPATQGVLYLPDGTTPVTANTPLNPSDAAGLIFKPAADFNGTVNIPFTVTDNNNATSALAMAPITVNPVNDPPVAVVTPAAGNEESPIPVSLTGTDVDGSIQHVTVTTLPPATQGVLYLPDGTTPVTANTPLSPSDAAGLIFKPAADFNGTVNIPFTVTDNSNVTSASATTPITVNPINDPPVAVVTPASGDEDTPIPVSLTGTDIDGTIQYVTVTTLPPAGQGVLYLADGTTPVVAGAQLTPTEAAGLVFQPAPDFNGTVNIPFTVTDNENGTSPQATAAISVNPVNDLPVGVTAPAVGNEDSPIPVSLSGTDIDGTIQYVTVTTLPPAGQGVLYLADGTTPVVAGAQLTPTEAAGLIFQPAPDFNGTVNIPFTVTDNNNATSAPANAQVTVTPINDLPVAVATSAAGNEGSLIPVSLTGTDIDGIIQSVTVTTLPPAGQGVLYLADGTTPVVAGAQLTPSQAAGLIFQPAGGFNGTVSLSFTVTDNESATSTLANALIIINPVNDPTLITGGTSGAGNEDTGISGTLTATDADGLADGSVYTVSTNAGHGTASIDPATGTWHYTPVGDYNGADSFTVSLTDDAGNTTTQVISLTIAAVADIQNDNLSTTEDTAVTILASDLLGNDSFEGSPVVTAVGSAAHGTVALVGGNLTYTPTGNYNGPDSFTYTVTSPTGVTETATVNVTVTPANDAPVAGDDSASTAINQPVTIDVKANDSDPDNANNQLTVSNPLVDPTKGSVTLNPDGTLTFTPVSNITGPVTITYTLTDPDGLTDTATVTINVGTNTAPAGTDNSFTFAEDSSQAFTAAAFGFTDADLGQTLQAVRIDSLPATGSLTLNGAAVSAGQIIAAGDLAQLLYTPLPNGNGAPYASFSFSVQDSAGAFDNAPNTITLNVTPVNDLPFSTPTTVNIAEDQTYVLGSSDFAMSDIDGTIVSVHVGSASGGVLQQLVGGVWTTLTIPVGVGIDVAKSVIDAGELRFVPVDDLNGNAVAGISYKPVDDLGGSRAVFTQVAIRIAAVADIQNDNLSTTEDTAVTILASDLLGNDSFEGSPVVTAVGSAAHGTVALVGGNLTYTPNGNYNGPDSFTYTVTSPTGVTETATVNVTVTPANDATTVTGGTSGAGNEDTTISGTLTATDADGLADGSVYTVSTNAGHGTASIDPATGAWHYTPVGDYNGADSFTVSLTDDAGNTTTQVISLTIAAVADIQNDNLSTTEDTAVTILASDLLGNDSFEGSPVVTAVGSAAHGTVALVGGNLTYTPDANYNGPDSFTYTVTSPTGVTETATVNVTVTPANDATTVTGGTSGAGNEDNTISGTLTATDADGLADGSVYTVSTNAGHGTASIDPATGAWHYTPVGDYNGADSFTVSLTDDAGNTTTQVISLTIAAVADIQNDNLSTTEDTAVTILASDLLGNDSFEGSPVVTAVGSAAHGTVALVGGNLTYTPNGNYNGPDSFTYTVTSPTGVTETATVNVTVTPANDATTVTGGTSGAGHEDTAISGTLTATDADGLTDGSVYTVSTNAGHGTASIDPATGAWHYTPVGDYNGADSFTVSLTDDAGNTTTQVISLTIAAVADIQNDNLSTTEDTAVTILASDLLGNDSFEGSPVVTAVGSAAHGTVALVGGNLTYTPNGNYNGPDSFTYTVTSPTGVTETATVNVTVTPANDATTVTGGTSGAGNEDTTISGTLTATDADGLADGSVYTVSTNAGHGTASIDPATGAWHYTPVGDYNGADSFTVSLTDDAGNTTTQVISLTIAAVADIQNDNLSTTEDTAVTILASDLLGNDSFEGSPVVTAVGSAAHGTVALVGGNLTYTPNGNYNGPDSFTYTVTSPTGVTETATVNVTVTPANDATTVTGGTSGAGHEDTAISGTLTATDADGLTDGSVYTVSTNAGHGTASIDPATGAWHYTPVGDYNGADSFTVSLTDDAGNTTTQVISLTIAAVADIQNDNLSTTEDTAVTILASDLLGNDSFEGSPVVTAVGSAAHGTVALVGGNLTYTPDANYNGPDSFTYTVTSPTGVTETATVNVTVTPANDATTVTGGTSGAGNEDNTISGTLTATDADGLADGSVYTVSTNAGHGTASIDPATGAWHYTPVGDYNGADSFTVSLTDDAGNTTTQVISLTIAAVADIQNDNLSTTEDTAVTILASDLLGNDSFEGSPVVTAVGSAAHGTVALVGGNLTYTPTGNYNGPDSFTYTVTSPTGVTETATVNVTVTPANDATTVTGGTSGAGNEDNTISGTLTATDADGLADGSVYTVSTNAGHGTASIDPATGAWHYTPVGDYNGADSFTVSLTDDAGNTTTQVISLTIAAVADIQNDNLTTAEDTAVTILATSLLANDNFEGSPVVTAVGSAAHGTVALVGGNLTYTPTGNYNGPDSFTYTVTSPTGVTETATVNVTVTPANDPTLITGGTSGAGNEDTTISGTLTATDADGLADGTVYTVSTNAGHGTASIDPATGTWNYTPVGDYHGADSFTVSLTDDAGNTTTQVISLTIAAVADIQNDNLSTTEDTAVTILASDLLGNDSFEGSPVVTAVGSAAHGTVALVGGNLTYTPNGNYNGPDSFTYTVTSPTGVTETATVNVTVTPANDATTVTGGTSGAGNEDTTISGTLTATDADGLADGSVYTVSTNAGHGTASIDPATGAWHYTPVGDYNGADSFTVSLTDDAGNTTTQVISLTIAAVADIQNDNLSTTEDTAVTILASDLLGNDSFEGSPVVTAVGSAAHGTVALVGGNLTYTPTGNYNGPDSFTYTVTSPTGVTETATVNVTVTPANDAPVAGDDSASTAINQPVTIDVKANDSDPDNANNQLTVSNPLVDPTKGSVTLNPDGTLTFTPVSNITGPVTITYTLTDPDGLTDTATVTINVGTNTAPAGTDNSFTFAEDSSQAFTAAAFGFTDADLGQTLQAVRIDSLPATGSLTLNGAAVSAGQIIAAGDLAQLLYTPLPNGNGAPYASFSFSVQDSAGAFDNAPNTITLNVTPVNDLPFSTPTTVNIAEDQTYVLGSSDFAMSDIDGTIVSVHVGSASGGVLQQLVGGVWTTLTIPVGVGIDVAKSVIDAGELRFVPVDDLNGNAVAGISYKPVDDLGGSRAVFTQVAIRIAAVADIQNDNLTTAEDTAVTILASDLLGNDSFEGSPVVTAVGSAAHGTVALVGGNLTYTPTGNYNGPDSFTYTVTSPTGVTETATVNVTVTPANDATTVTGGTSGAGNEDNTISGTLTATDADGLADGSVYTVSTNAGHGTASIDPATGAWHYTPVGDYNGADSFTVSLTDDAGNTTTQVISLTIAAVADIQNDNLSTTEDTAVTILASDLLGNDSFEGSPVVTAVGSAAHGTVALVGGNLTYTPNGNYNGPDSFTYTVTSPTGVTETATVNVTVTPANDAPVVGNASVTVSEEGLAGGIADGDGNPTDSTNLTVRSGTLSVLDIDSAVSVSLLQPLSALTAGGVAVTWSGSGTQTLIGSAGGIEVLRATIDNAGNYTVTLSKAIDHEAGNDENIAAIELRVSVSDGVAAPVLGNLTVNIEDDMPVLSNTTNTIAVDVDTIVINSLQAGWINPLFLGGTNQTSQTNTDADSFTDKILWGNPASGSGQSGYTLVDSTAFVSAVGTEVHSGELFKLADFSHLNWPIYSNSSTLDKVTLTMTMNVVINGVSTPINFTVLLDHTETPNDGADPRDIITLPTQDVTVSLAGQDYVFRLEGFKNDAGQIVNTIYTDEQATNPFGIYGSVSTVDPLPTVTGSVGGNIGADGLGTVTWGNTSSTYGTMVANADGTYQFVVNRATRDSLAYGDLLTQTFAYTITDKDGDLVAGSVTIEIKAPEVVELTSTSATISGLNMGLSGEYFGYNDTRTGTASDPAYQGTTSIRLHSDDGTADAGDPNNVDRLADVEEIIEGRNNNTNLINNAILSDPMKADATFSANKLEFGLPTGSNIPLFSNDLGQNGKVTSGTISATAGIETNNLYTFLKVSSGNVDGLAATSGLGDTTDAIIRMVGYIYIPAGGVYDMRVTADDGYRVLINGQNLAQVDFIQATATKIYTGVTLSEGLQPIEILYWDQGGHASLRVEFKVSGAADTTYKIIGNDEYALFSPTDVPVLGANQDIVESSTSNGVWQIRDGETYNGTNEAEKIVGSDGKDTIHAGGGNDIVQGGNGSDLISGGAGDDVLTGGLGSDTFAWTLADQGSVGLPAKDIITDFNVASKATGGDVLDLRDLLPTATTVSALDTYLNFSKSGSDTVIDVKPDGTNVTQTIVLAGVDLGATGTNDATIIQDLLTKGKLITD
ncbi:retention module-containing protein [Ferribacterium limneticum]|uniref:retention module-containing protein n=1 Tax=Ferribacterium limneticum TaxID=76259 RepID=UPI001CFB27DD|nr:retention module-containing protein [Ferribacterium limneticum]UCV29450.1 retention module-containing protein [Ferribacterium limneticum]UCV33369.1 retention module-containing protein [Ferribacterium limneticum]